MILSHIWRLYHDGAIPAPRLRLLRPASAASLLLLTLAVAGTAAARETIIVAFGDSLTAGYRLPAGQSFPAQLEAALRKRGHAVRVVNGGVSGDTAAAGLARLDWTVPKDADAVILELGANDALRGFDPAKTKRDLDGVLRALKRKGLAVLLAGMQAPRNMGPEYVRAFDAIYPTLAEKHGVLLYPFFLDGIATDPKLNLDDGMHPTGRGVAVIVERILPSVEKLIEHARANPKPRG